MLMAKISECDWCNKDLRKHYPCPFKAVLSTTSSPLNSKEFNIVVHCMCQCAFLSAVLGPVSHIFNRFMLLYVVIFCIIMSNFKPNQLQL